MNRKLCLAGFRMKIFTRFQGQERGHPLELQTTANYLKNWFSGEEMGDLKAF